MVDAIIGNNLKEGFNRGENNIKARAIEGLLNLKEYQKGKVYWLRREQKIIKKWTYIWKEVDIIGWSKWKIVMDTKWICVKVKTNHTHLS